VTDEANYFLRFAFSASAFSASACLMRRRMALGRVGLPSLRGASLCPVSDRHCTGAYLLARRSTCECRISPLHVFHRFGVLILSNSGVPNASAYQNCTASRYG
jgi:hypothetical protein